MCSIAFEGGSFDFKGGQCGFWKCAVQVLKWGVSIFKVYCIVENWELFKMVQEFIAASKRF